MQTCPECGRAFESQRCPFCADAVSHCTNTIKMSAWTVALGYFGTRVIVVYFPWLEWSSAFLQVSLLLFFTPAASMLFMFALGTRRWVRHFELARQISVLAASLSIIFAAFALFNGVLDRQRSMEIPSRVIRKETGLASRVGGTLYALDVSLSWDQKPIEMECFVTKQKFADVEVGDLVRLVVHRGAFSRAWYSDVLLSR